VTSRWSLSPTKNPKFRRAAPHAWANAFQDLNRESCIQTLDGILLVRWEQSQPFAAMLPVLTMRLGLRTALLF
jgi:hypothetical protein